MLVKKSIKKIMSGYTLAFFGVSFFAFLGGVHASMGTASGQTLPPLVSRGEEIRMEDGFRFSINSWTFPPLSRLDLSMKLLGGRAYSDLDRNQYFDSMVSTRNKFSKAQVEAEIYLPSSFNASQRYPFLVYLPGSGGMCTSEKALVRRMTGTGAVMVVVKSNLSRAGGNKHAASTSENQLDKNHLSLAVDAVLIAELLENHPNVRGVGAMGSSLGAVALTALAERSISGPLYNRSVFIRPDDLATGGSNWIGSSPFRALFLLTPTFPLQLKDAMTPSQTRVSVFSGAFDTWCEVGPTLNALSKIKGLTKLHLIDMGHGPETLWEEEWRHRVSKYATKFQDRSPSLSPVPSPSLSPLVSRSTIPQVNTSPSIKRIVLCSTGENISDCAAVFPAFSLFGLAERGDLLGALDHEAQGRLGQNLCMQIQGSYPGSESPPQPCDSRALTTLLRRTSKGTLLESDAPALEYIVGKIGEELKFVQEDWSQELWTEAVSETFKTQALASKGLRALEPFGDRLRVSTGNPLQKRELLEEALRECVTYVPRSSLQSSSGDAFAFL